MTYAMVWQNVEAPARSFDSERSLVSTCMLAVFDKVLRSPCQDDEMFPTLLSEDGGYAISLSVCVANYDFFKTTAARMELAKPHLAKARNGCLAYLRSVEACCAKKLFALRMPDKIEVRKYGTTLIFLKKVLERCGYPLCDPENPNPPPEIESLTEWMCADTTPLYREHPEWHMLRDMAALYKFLVTMETKESELMRKRMSTAHFVSWSLSFEEESDSGAYSAARGGTCVQSRFVGRSLASGASTKILPTLRS